MGAGNAFVAGAQGGGLIFFAMVRVGGGIAVCGARIGAWRDARAVAVLRV